LSGKLSKVLVYGALISGILAVAIPYLWMASCSFKGPVEIFEFPPSLFPKSMYWGNFEQIFNSLPIPRIFFNSFFVSISTTLSALLFGSLAGYAFAKLKFYGQKLLFALALSTMLLPFVLFIIPRFIIINNLKLVGTYGGLILPFAMNGLTIFLFKQFFDTIPNDIRDAAIVDGCSELGVLFRIMLPLSKPILIVAGIFTFMDSWNNFLWALIMTMGRPNMMTIPVGLAYFSQSYVTYWGASMAMATLSTLPIIGVYFIFQRYFIESIALTGLKG